MRLPQRKRALMATAAAAALLATGTAAPSIADDHGGGLKGKQKRVQAQIKGAQAELDESSSAARAAGTRLLAARASLARAQRTLTTTQAHLTSARKRDAVLRGQLAAAKKKLAQAQSRLDAAREKVTDQRAAVGRVAAQSMQGADPQLMGVVALMTSHNPSDLATQVQTAGNVLDRQNQLLDALRTAESRVAVQKRQVQKATAAVAAQKKAAHDNVVEQGRLVAAAKTQRARITTLVAARASAQRAADKARDSDKAQVDALKRENDKIGAMLAARARKAASYGNTAPSGSGPLQRPVSGYVTSPFGYRVHPIYGYYSLHDGTDFHAPCGTPLRAAGNGRVISEYYQSAWGNRLILDLGRVNGHGVSVIYNHLSSYRARTGQSVSRGETVGYAGTTGWSTGCHLHFTVMVDGKPQNPMDWF